MAAGSWAVMANHYHFVGDAPGGVDGTKLMVKALHSRAAIWLNRHDGIAGRKVLYQYWDTCLTDEKSYLARLHYVHHNPVKHGLVENAANYPWCSMNWFCQNARAGFRRTVLSFKTDRVSVPDDF